MKTPEELLQYSLAWDKAIVQNNVEAMSRFMANDWVCVATDGGVTSRTDFLSTIRSGALVHTRMDTDESSVKIYGDAGLVIGKGTSAGFWNNKPFSFYEWSTSVFAWQNNTWICVLTMLTPAR